MASDSPLAAAQIPLHLQKKLSELMRTCTLYMGLSNCCAPFFAATLCAVSPAVRQQPSKKPRAHSGGSGALVKSISLVGSAPAPSTSHGGGEEERDARRNEGVHAGPVLEEVLGAGLGQHGACVEVDAKIGAGAEGLRVGADEHQQPVLWQRKLEDEPGGHRVAALPVDSREHGHDAARQHDVEGHNEQVARRVGGAGGDGGRHGGPENGGEPGSEEQVLVLLEVFEGQLAEQVVREDGRHGQDGTVAGRHGRAHDADEHPPADEGIHREEAVL
eukprot:scaffold4548_cov107-Isochrysis_galbana.AAC.6